MWWGKVWNWAALATEFFHRKEQQIQEQPDMRFALGLSACLPGITGFQGMLGMQQDFNLGPKMNTNKLMSGAVGIEF